MHDKPIALGSPWHYGNYGDTLVQRLADRETHEGKLSLLLTPILQVPQEALLQKGVRWQEFLDIDFIISLEIEVKAVPNCRRSRWRRKCVAGKIRPRLAVVRRNPIKDTWGQRWLCQTIAPGRR